MNSVFASLDGVFKPFFLFMQFVKLEFAAATLRCLWNGILLHFSFVENRLKIAIAIGICANKSIIHVPHRHCVRSYFARVTKRRVNSNLWMSTRSLGYKRLSFVCRSDNSIHFAWTERNSVKMKRILKAIILLSFTVRIEKTFRELIVHFIKMYFISNQ